MTTLTRDLLDHIATCREDGSDAARGVLADHLDECGEHDRAELIRVQVELGRLLGGNERFHRSLSEYGLTNKGKRRHPAIASLLAREHELTARNPAWLSVPCPECGADNCPHCVGNTVSKPGDLLGDRTALTRGFLTVTLPSSLCWVDGEGPNGGLEYDVHPVLAAILRSPVGIWVEAVRVSDRVPIDEYPHSSGDPARGGWGWRDEGLENGPENVPTILFKGDVTLIHPTAEAANDALARALPRWARARLGDAR